MDTSANTCVGADRLFRQKPQTLKRKCTGCKADAHLPSLQIISHFSSSWCWLLSEPALLSWVTGLTPLLCRCGCSASCLHLLPSPIPCVPTVQSPAFQKHRHRTLLVQQGAAVEGSLLRHAEALLLLLLLLCPPRG